MDVVWRASLCRRHRYSSICDARSRVDDRRRSKPWRNSMGISGEYSFSKGHRWITNLSRATQRFMIVRTIIERSSAFPDPEFDVASKYCSMHEEITYGALSSFMDAATQDSKFLSTDNSKSAIAMRGSSP